MLVCMDCAYVSSPFPTRDVTSRSEDGTMRVCTTRLVIATKGTNVNPTIILTLDHRSRNSDTREVLNGGNAHGGGEKLRLIINLGMLNTMDKWDERELR